MKIRFLSRLSFAIALIIAQVTWSQDDVALVSTVVPPNVMILMDNSGSMAHTMWADGFDSGVFHDVGPVTTACNIGTVPASAGSAGFCPASGDPSGQCPNNGRNIRAGNIIRCSQASIPGDCAAAPAGWSCWVSSGQVRMRLPDLTPGGSSTRWSRNYLSWLFTQIMAGNTPPTPNSDRLETAKSAILNLIDLINPDGFNDNVRFGLAKFDSGSDPQGGSIDAPVSTGNKNALQARITNLQPTTWTPLAETMAEIGEYLSGDNSIHDCNAAGNIGNSNPMDDHCRKSFVIILTDGEPTRDDFDHNNWQAGFMCAIGNADNDTNEIPTPEAGRTDAPPYTSRGTDWLDDVTYAYYDRDLRADLQGKQNIVTYTIGFTIDHPLLSDAAANSTGFYYIASSADELADTLHAAVLDIIERATAFSAATVPASRTSFSDGFYSAWFTPRLAQPFWDGHIEAFRLSSTLEVLDRNGNPALDPISGNFLDPRYPFWDVAERLVDPAHPPRQIFTRKAGARVDFTPVNIDAADLGVVASDLNLYPNPSAPSTPWPDAETLTDALVDYLHGRDRFDDDGDGDATERREFVLGDVFHSNPLIVGSPPFALSLEEGFGPPTLAGTFLNLYENRDRVLYAGANDGMLHAVDAGRLRTGDNPATPEVESEYYDMGTGNERFAHIPELVRGNLKHIPRNIPRAYYYVDGSPAAADAWFASGIADSTKEPTEWTTTLVTGLRQGGPGYFALDVTDPGAISGAHAPYPKLLWELDDPSEPLGESWSEPIITRLKLGAPMNYGDKCGLDDGEGDCREQWVMIVGGGFLAEADPNLAAYISSPSDPSWTDDSKSIFIVALDTGQVLAKLAHDPADPQLQNMVYALPSTPAVLDLDFDGFADLVYVGDTGGQLWKWDISGVGYDSDADGLVDNWPAGVFFETPPVTVSGGGLHYRSVFFPLAAAFVDQDLVLAFATGERTQLTYQGDPAADDNNRFYKIRDPVALGAGSIPTSPYGESDLTDITGLTDDNDTTDLGYYFVANDAEKFITNHIIFFGFVISTSYLPDDGSGGVCDTIGEAFIHIFDLATGAGFFDVADPAVSNSGRTLLAGLGVPTDPRITSSDGENQLFVQTSLGSVVAIDAPGGGSDVIDIVYWKQDL